MTTDPLPSDATVSEMPGFQTRAIHHGYEPSENLGALTPPIYMTSTFAFEDAGGLSAVVAGDAEGYFYGREHNPTQDLLERRIASLEGGEDAVTAASGMAAISMALLTLLSPGDELIVHHTLYSVTSTLVSQGLSRFGITIVSADLSTTEGLSRAIGPKAKIVYFETPLNPTGDVLDISALSAVAHGANLLVVVDSTFASPAVQRPIEHGADIVVHSLTKYINGHGDLLGGIVVGSAELIGRIRSVGLRFLTGAAISPMTCFLVLRGLKTLKLRMRQHGENALAVAQMLAAHPHVSFVRYPYLPTDPGFAIASRQMTNGSGILSFELRSGYEGAVRMMNRLRLVRRAVSLGDVESLIMHPGSIVEARRKTHPEATPGVGVTMGLLRLSVGLEESADIIQDLFQAIEG